MSLTKIGSIGINTGIQLAGVTTVATLHVGSGVTLSSDGDGFFTGIITATFAGDGTNLTGVASTDDIRTNTNATFLQNINVSGSTTTGSLVSSGAISGTTGTFSAAVSGTTGTFTGNITISNQAPALVLTDTDHDSDFNIQASGGILAFNDSTNSATRLQINSAGDIKVGSAITFQQNGGVSIAGLTTANGGIQITGGNITLDDSSGSSNDRIILGNGSDFHIFFDGTNSVLREPNSVAGQLIIDGYNGTDIRRGETGEHMIRAIGAGAVELYYNGSKKAQTTSTGMQTVETVKMKYGSNGVNLKQVFEQGVGNTASTTAAIGAACVGGGTVTITCMHNGNTSITTTKMFPIMFQGPGTVRLGSEMFSINANTAASFSVSAATLGVTVTNNTGNHAKIRVTFDVTANA